ncbi:MAG: type II toxin-antitoxin system PemK/MazF family toxin [Longimicrobiaceae bacterium]
MTKGKVVLVPFPFDDLSASKVRAAVCLTESFGPHRHVVLAFITSVLPSPPTETDLVLTATDPGFGQTGLKVPSALRLHRLLTVSMSLIVRQLGALSRDQQKAVEDRLRYLFGL